MKIKIVKDVNVTDQDIDDIMVTALEGGINYHVGEVEVKNKDYKGGKYASDVISRGGELILHDMESEEYTRTLSKENFIEGLTKFLNEHTEIIDADGSIDCGAIDADYADVIIQYAVFGELIFG